MLLLALPEMSCKHMNRSELNIAAWQERSVAAGPGERFLVWLQGCPRRCRGCINEDFISFTERHIMPTDKLAEMILSLSGIDGATLSGGEPFSQAAELDALCEVLIESNLSIVCYTGYTLDELMGREDPYTHKLLSKIDVLIDGPFIESKAANLKWRGSDNQQIHYLTDRYQHLLGECEPPKASVEMIISQGELVTTGNWPPGFVEALERELSR